MQQINREKKADPGGSALKKGFVVQLEKITGVKISPLGAVTST